MGVWYKTNELRMEISQREKVADVLQPNRPRVFLIRLIQIGASVLAALPV